MFGLAVKWEEQKPELMSGRAWTRALKAAMTAMGHAWRARCIARHFQADAKGKYQYQPRSRGYMIRKMGLAKIGAVQEGGFVDLIYSGKLREYMQTTAVVRGYPTRCTIDMTSPRSKQGVAYATMNPKNPNKPNLAAEILKVTPEERSELIQIGQEELDRQIDSWWDKHEELLTGDAPSVSVAGYFHIESDAA